MTDPTDTDELMCALLAALIARHGWGSPTSKDTLINKAPIASHLEGDAKDVFEDLRRKSFIIDRGNRGIKINSSEQGTLAEYLEHTCGWDRITIDLRLKHFEGYRE